MIVIPMLGRSSRFFNAGYSQPKYQLPLRGQTVFAQSVRSFERQFSTTPFVFLVRSDFNAKDFVGAEVARLGLTDYRIIEFGQETCGQAETVLLGTGDYADTTPLIVFNIDTIRHGFTLPPASEFGDGFLEVFEGDGENWSFVEPGPGNTVLRTTEKDRISNLCSNGLYGFARLGDFRQAVEAVPPTKGELYIAPLYNHLIGKGMSIRYRLLDPPVTEHCGTPQDYERLRQKE